MEIKDPKESANFIANVADHVKINDEGVEKCAQEILKRVNDKRLSLSLKLYKDSGVHPLDIEDKDIEWVFVVSALNFSFWEEPGDKPYLVTYKGKTHHGYMSMCAAINRCLDQGVNLTEPKVYGNITEDQLNCYLMGDNAVPIPMLKERLQCLHDIAQVLNDKYAGKFANCLRECSSAQELLKRTVEEFPCFDDSHFYKAKKLAIHKRAQILVADLWQLFEGKGLCQFEDINSISMFADYRVPQSLLYFGAFSYSDELMTYLKSDRHMESGDPKEVEIRGCSIEATERIVKRVNELSVPINSIQVDNFLWGFRREKVEEMNAFPFHRVRSIYY